MGEQKKSFFAKLAEKLKGEVKAELIIDDVNGASRTFPEISNISEIKEGIAVTEDDGTYVFADGMNTVTVVVLAGVVDSVTIDEPAPAAAVTDDPALGILLEGLVNESKSQKETIASLKKEIVDFKASFKHGSGQEPAKTNVKQFKTV